jgi:diaminopimelate epimerase
MMRHFHKMHGLGNDFVIVDARSDPLDMTPDLAKAISDRRTGIGCDQLILLEPSESADLKMRIWNQDGGEVESCGNATRCVFALTGVSSVETGGGLLRGSARDKEVEVDMGPPRLAWSDVPLAYAMDTASLPMSWDELASPMALSVGNPHLVFFVESPSAIPLEELGPRIENDPAFPERINVNVAQVGDKSITLRTWERGAGLTRACGTGACATAVAAIASKRASSPVRVTMPGGSLTIAWEPGASVLMRGAATHVFSGELDMAALA